MVEKNEFAWTPELITEFAEYYHEKSSYGVTLLLELFISSKQPPSVQRDWEILTFWDGNDDIITKADDGWFKSKEGWPSTHMPLDAALSSKVFKIHSVKRLSDGEKFTIGDTVTSNNPDEAYQIIWFTERGPVMTADHSMGYINIMFAKKSKPVLFTTLDGKPIYENEKFWYVNPSFKILAMTVTKENYSGDAANTFSTEAKAIEHVIEYKPCLSVNDLIKHGIVYFYLTETVNKLNALAKSKINNL